MFSLTLDTRGEGKPLTEGEVAKLLRQVVKVLEEGGTWSLPDRGNITDRDLGTIGTWRFEPQEARA